MDSEADAADEHDGMIVPGITGLQTDNNTDNDTDTDTQQPVPGQRTPE